MNKNPPDQSPNNSRRYDFDWLRALAILGVFIYHSLRFFNLEDWVIKNPSTYPVLENLANFTESWMMPLIFVVSGASVFFASLKNKPAIRFIQDKSLRLFVPFVVGVFTFSLFQVYLERISHGDFEGSLWAFLPHYFEGFYGLGGNFAWMGLHLWYLEVLFVFSLIFLPVILLLRTNTARWVIHKLTGILAAPGAVYLLPVAAILSWKLLDPDSLLSKPILGWSFAAYFTFFLAGYLLVSSEELGRSIERQRWISLIGVLTASILFFITNGHDDILAWFAILACLGFARRHLNFPSPYLVYANQAILPFYIHHQPVLVFIGYSVVLWQIPDPLKYVFIAIPSLILTLGLYELLVRRFNLTRFLFGMKPVKPQLNYVEPVPLNRLNATILSLVYKFSPRRILKRISN
jgi:glucan biosynthesis protein C